MEELRRDAEVPGGSGVVRGPLKSSISDTTKPSLGATNTGVSVFVVCSLSLAGTGRAGGPR